MRGVSCNLTLSKQIESIHILIHTQKDTFIQLYIYTYSNSYYLIYFIIMYMISFIILHLCYIAVVHMYSVLSSRL